MSSVFTLKTPLSASMVIPLKAADIVLLTGEIYTARDMAHKYLCRQINQGELLPFDLNGAVIYFVGPTPARPGRAIGAAGPTTSSRMDPFSPILLAQGLKAMIGKGYRAPEMRDALQAQGAVHLSAVGGAGALLSKHIIKAEVIAYQELAAEAVRRLQVKEFPTVVAYDAHGGSIYTIDNKEEAI